MTPRHVKAFLKDDKIVFEINEKPKPVGNSKYSDLEIWQSQHQYLEGAEEQKGAMRKVVYIQWIENHPHKNDELGFDSVFEQGIQIDPSLIEIRSVCYICGELSICNEYQIISLVYLKESEGQDELWDEIFTELKVSGAIGTFTINQLKSKFTITRK